VTLLQVEDQKVTKILTEERDGYHGLQVGYFTKSEMHLNKPDTPRLRKCVDAADMMRRYCNREDAAWVFDAARQAIDGKGKEPT